MKLGKPLLVSLLALLPLALGQGGAQPPTRVAGTPAQVLSAFRSETLEGILFLGLPGDESLWAQVLPYLAEGRAIAFTPVCPQAKPRGAKLYKLPNPGKGLLFLLRSKSKTLLATGTPERVEGIVTDTAAYPLFKRQLNLEAFEAQAPKAFPLCP
jgi:hypothetical protein